MRLCLVGNFSSIHVQRWVRYFVERGYDVHGLAYEPTAPPVEGMQMHALMKRSDARLRPPPDPATRRLPLGFGVAKTGLQWLRHGLRAAVRAIRPDILHGHFVLEHGFYAALSGFSPLVVSAWGSDLLIHPQVSAVNRLLVTYTLRRSALVHTASPLLTDKAREFGVRPERTLTAPWGIEESWLALHPAARAGGRSIVISTRAFSEVYDLPTLLRAVAVLRRRHPEALVRLAGDGPLRASLEALVSRLGLGEHVKFLGFLPRERLAQALAEADIYVSTSLSDGTSVSLLEAMAVGLVPVVSDIPANRGWVTDGVNGFLASPTDADAFAEKLSQALERPEEWRRQAAIHNKALIRTRALWNEQMRKIEAAYQKLVPEPRG